MRPLLAGSARALLALALLGGCARKGEPNRSEPADAMRLCASACATLVSCPSDEPTKQRQGACVAACLTARSNAEVAECAAEHHAYLACVSRQPAACASSAVAPGTALEHALGISGCAREHAAYFRCSEVCRDRGAVWTRSTRLPGAGRERDVSAELIPNGCAPKAPSPQKKSAAGAPCTHHSVCGSEVCACQASRVRFLARVCDDGRCAGAPTACTLAPQVVGHDPCPGRDGSRAAP